VGTPRKRPLQQADAPASLNTCMNDMHRRVHVGFLVLMALAGWGVLSPLTLPQDLASWHAPARAPAPEERELTLLFVGDVMLSRGVGARMKAKDDWNLPFEEVADTLRSADLRFCNLECPISDRGHNLHHLYSFRADPLALEGLKAAGFNVVSQANNHSDDWGLAALLDSLERLRAAGIHPVGAGQNALEAHYPVVVNVSGLRVAFLAYVEIDPKEATAGVDRPGVAWLDPPQVLADIRFARALADLIIVCPHWGVEYALKPTRDQVEFAHRMIDAGADLIVGSHPHVVQPLETYHERWIAYSLGNFVFDQKNAATHRGLMLKVTVRGKQIAAVTPVPININHSFQAVLTPPLPLAPAPTLAERKSLAAGAE
jgi:poly-gamma-glutamate capsule biosynthesis protein CapA/YwtB (metallophosphatase superfamily)